jgi:hypothetical protein
MTLLFAVIYSDLRRFAFPQVATSSTSWTGGRWNVLTSMSSNAVGYTWDTCARNGAGHCLMNLP